MPVAEEPAAEIPLRQVVRRPHPAVKEIRDRPGRLPKFARRRCVLIVHSLVTEALARGWTITPVLGTTHQDRWSGKTIGYDTQALLLIDAGHAPIGLVFDEVTKREPHQDTPKEAADRAAGKYVHPPAYDYLGTGRLRLHLTENNRKTDIKFVDGVRKTVEHQLVDILNVIEDATKRALHLAEQQRIREEEEEARRREAHRIGKLRDEYEKWECQLHERTDAWARHRGLTEFLDEVPVGTDGQSGEFVEWARGLLGATDPRRNFPRGRRRSGPTRSGSGGAGQSRNRSTDGSDDTREARPGQ
ncbi:hypothetical protein G7085_10550 [Tessaracoccus sp. HDW20]|uniref:hypothetical protein n=1 Tax=Tessaracoccus coleopterorum TaxID=2714950 RepID=UPI0018D49A12|nr:hypothetical protein [Tessaracoccus coleopterorum]NHB84895.1 hypothetical protein [Tessaracoccus coleopterorum]